MSRKLIFVSGMLACFDAVLSPLANGDQHLFDDPRHRVRTVQEQLRHYIELTPLEVLSSAVLRYAPEPERRLALVRSLLTPYDEFVEMLGDEQTRKALKTIAPVEAESSDLFARGAICRAPFPRWSIGLVLQDRHSLDQCGTELWSVLMRNVGYSTGAISKGDFESALDRLKTTSAQAVELSALRESELVPLLSAFSQLDLRKYVYVAIHAPKSFSTYSEQQVVDMLKPFTERGIHIVVHPDELADLPAWRDLGKMVCIENMDSRKATGRTADELADVFEVLPQASMCLDLGHARQVDPSMGEALTIVKRFGNRIAQIHVSEVVTAGHHWGMSHSCSKAFEAFSELFPASAAIIVESQVPTSQLSEELESAREILGTTARENSSRGDRANPFG